MRDALVHETATIHPFALVTESAIGARSKVWQFASVIRGAVIGDDCSISSGALVDGSRIGSRSIVSQNVAMGPGFLVGEGVFIGPNVTLCNDAWPRASKAHFPGFMAALGFHNDAERRKHVAIVIERDAAIGANAVILPGVILGEGCMVSAGAVVNSNVPPRVLFRADGTLRKITPEIEDARLETRIRHAPCLQPPVAA